MVRVRNYNVYLWVLFAGLIGLTGPGHAGFSPIENDLRPDYQLVQLRPADWEIRVTDLGWLSTGQLLVLDWGGLHSDVHLRQFLGKIWIVNGVQNASGPGDVDYSIWVEGMEDPMGMVVLGDTVYAEGGYYLYEHVDADADGAADITDTLFNFNYERKCRHEFLFGLVYKEPNFYVAASVCKDDGMAGCQTCQTHTGRGSTYLINRFTRESRYINGGLRTPYSMGLGPNDDVFLCDDQGNWLPSSKLIHVQEGKFYDFEFDNMPQQDAYGTVYDRAPPALWLPHGIASHSPSEPLLVKEGIFTGQLLIGDVAYGGIQRAFLEKVNGEYQGAYFNWTGGLEAGVGCLLWGQGAESQALYVGGVGDGDQNNWGWRGFKFGLQKLVPIPGALTVFEPLAVYSRYNGMEIAFTLPLNETSALNAGNYLVSRYEMLPGTLYGEGNMMHSWDVSVSNITLSEDKKNVFLEIDFLGQIYRDGSLQPNTVLDITLANGSGGIISENSDTLWVNRAWYTLNAISESVPFSAIGGCMDPRYAEYDPIVTVPVQEACSTLGIGDKPAEGGKFQILLRMAGRELMVSLPDEGPHRVEVWSLSGQLLAQRNGEGRKVYTFNRLKGGSIYLVKVKNRKHRSTRKILMF
jgi:hypothetical protein